MFILLIILHYDLLIDKAIKSWHLHVSGQVQGIGFRPLVYKVANRFEINGWVKNDLDGLHIEFNAREDVANKFKEEITVSSAPLNARITQVVLAEISIQEFSDFRILHDDTAKETNLLLTPDIALCQACKDDLSNHGDRRYDYAFISCSHCGPRFSIIEDLPYDRMNTSMDSFKLCSDCLAEYSNPIERRYYAQINSCPSCGIMMQLHNSNKQLLTEDADEIVELIMESWVQGKIVAIKGIGGYLLTCDAAHVDAVVSLRERKKRLTKPFAIMVPHTGHLNNFEVNSLELAELKNHVSPIVLLTKTVGQILFTGIADGLDSVGIMLPYAPIFKVLLDKFQKPIIATSANVSNAAIIYKDNDAQIELSKITDFIVSNNRSIVVPQDDSVIKITPKEKQKIIIRRSRGLAPTFINSIQNWPSETIMCMGAQLKSTFSLLHKKNVYISQYLGNLDHFESLHNYKVVQKHFIDLLNAIPTVIVIDMHPDYQSSVMGAELSDSIHNSLHVVQHHEAHFSAIIGEHNLIDDADPILGVMWDGLGLGDDGHMWGGEFFIYKDYQFARCCHLSYFDLILHDKMAKEPRLSALSLCSVIPEAQNFLKEKFSNQEWKIYSKLIAEPDNLKTSSMGRLFDAVSSLLGIMDKQTFEGEAAMHLEVSARKYFSNTNYQEFPCFDHDKIAYHDLRPTDLVTCILFDLFKGVDKNLIAAKFHVSLVMWIEAVADKEQCEKIAFSGGVFQNSLLVDLIILCLKKNYKLYFHEQLSSNDENISFGQLVNYMIRNKLIEN